MSPHRPSALLINLDSGCYWRPPIGRTVVCSSMYWLNVIMVINVCATWCFHGNWSFPTTLSHDVAAPLTPTNQEVAGYINYSAQFVPYLSWRLVRNGIVCIIDNMVSTCFEWWDRNCSVFINKKVKRNISSDDKQNEHCCHGMPSIEGLQSQWSRPKTEDSTSYKKFLPGKIPGNDRCQLQSMSGTSLGTCCNMSATVNVRYLTRYMLQYVSYNQCQVPH